MVNKENIAVISGLGLEIMTRLLFYEHCKYRVCCNGNDERTIPSLHTFQDTYFNSIYYIFLKTMRNADSSSNLVLKQS